MELIRLQELSVISESTKSKFTSLSEAKSPTTDFDGIRAVVEDALADLNDKVGKGGALATLMKTSGASKLDTEKDADGKNILAQIVAKTTDYKKALEKLLTEAEILVSQVNEEEILDGDLIVEGKDYSDSTDFTEEFYSLFKHVNDLKSVMKVPRWIKWLKTTDLHFGTESEEAGRTAISALDDLQVHLNEVSSELDKAA